jgi:Rrf2 family protein
MKLNTTSQYAIRVVTYLALNNKNLSSSKKISNELQIPYKSLARIITQLVNSNIVTSSRGRDGGIKLEKKLSDIKVNDIMEAVNESLHNEECILGLGACKKHDKCPLHDRWTAPKEEIINIFQNTSVEDLNKTNCTIKLR